MTSRSALVVVVDGPSGSGKSSTSRQVARELGLRYLDTGAMYRAVTWWLLGQGVDVTDAQTVAAGVRGLRVEIGTDPADAHVIVNGEDAGADIRTREVTNAVSAVSAVAEVRELLVTVQRRVLSQGGVVAEGRDLGTVVAPDADVKVFLTADSEARAARRHRQARLGDVETIHDEMRARDAYDSTRELSPLTMADDAVLIDSTKFSLDEVVARIVALAHAAQAQPVREREG